MNQINIFEDVEKRELQAFRDRTFLEWKALPFEKMIPAISRERPDVKSELARDYCRLWKGAVHRCHELPEGVHIWLNETEPPEYWVINRNRSPAGEHIEACPFCGADLKHGGGDVTLIKADDSWWRILGYI